MKQLELNFQTCQSKYNCKNKNVKKYKLQVTILQKILDSMIIYICEDCINDFRKSFENLKDFEVIKVEDEES